MSPDELVKKSLLTLQGIESSNFKEIMYGTLTVKAIVEYGDFRKITKQEIGSEKTDEISFLEVNLSKAVRGASVVYDNTEYFVEDFTIANGLYKLFCTNTKQYGNSGRR